MTPRMKIATFGRGGLAVFAGLLFLSEATAQDQGTRPVDRIKAENVAEQEPKIVGGIPAPAGKYKFQVALISSSIPNGLEQLGQFCGGSLIDDRWILTAAHCIPNTEPDEVDIYLGTNELPTQLGGATGQRLHLDAIISHPAYDPSTNDSDLALLHLTEAPFSELKTAVVATPELDQSYVFPLGDAVVIGWGATAEGASTTPQLMRVWVDVQDSVLCESNYQLQFPSINISDNMFCAGLAEGGMDSCQGDSGGFIGAPIGGGEYVQLGIVSWGIGCARPELFGVYTRVGNFHEWINQEIEDFE